MRGIDRIMLCGKMLAGLFFFYSPQAIIISMDGSCLVISVDNSCPIISMDGSCPVISMDSSCLVISMDNSCPDPMAAVFETSLTHTSITKRRSSGLFPEKMIECRGLTKVKLIGYF